jgi:hypothetical protein
VKERIKSRLATAAVTVVLSYVRLREKGGREGEIERRAKLSRPAGRRRRRKKRRIGGGGGEGGIIIRQHNA